MVEKKKTTVKEVVHLDVANQEFERWAFAMDIELNDPDRDVKKVKDDKRQRRLLVSAIQFGAMVINENGEAVYTACRSGSKYKDPITFHEKKGSTLLASDQRQEGQDIAKMYAMMADMAKVPVSAFVNMVGKDLNCCVAIAAFLMA